MVHNTLNFWKITDKDIISWKFIKKLFWKYKVLSNLNKVFKFWASLILWLLLTDDTAGEPGANGRSAHESDAEHEVDIVPDFDSSLLPENVNCTCHDQTVQHPRAETDDDRVDKHDRDR